MRTVRRERTHLLNMNKILREKISVDKYTMGQDAFTRIMLIFKCIKDKPA